MQAEAHEYDRQAEERSRVEARGRLLAAVAVVAAIVGGLVLSLDVGLSPGDAPGTVLLIVEGVAVALLAIEYVHLAMRRESWRTFLTMHWLAVGGVTLVLAAAVGLIVYSLASPANVGGGLAAILRGLLAVLVLAHIGRLIQWANHRRVPPALVFVGSFVSLIAIGSVVLSLPACTPDDHPIGLLDAVFTSTSATCVTGLIVRDTSSDFTLAGQVVILVLIQLGGLSVMTFAGFFMLSFGGGLSPSDHASFGQFLNVGLGARVSALVRFIFVSTLVIEAVGAVVFYVTLAPPPGGFANDGEHVFFAVFHAVSAFCNAGFSLYPGSFLPAAQGGGMAPGDHGTWAALSLTALVVLGGVGFAVLHDLLRFNPLALPLVRRIRWPRLARRIERGFRSRSRRRGGPLTGRLERRPVPRFSTQTRLVLWATMILLVVGALGTYLLELPSSGGASNGSALDAWFQSTNARTAGFNSVGIGSLRPGTLFFLMLLMFVGASPGSTGGGIKTVTAAILVASVVAMVRGRPRIELAGRHLPVTVEKKALVMIACAFVTVAAVAFVLTLSETDTPFLPLLFEAVSAFATVGLSTGITSGLSGAGKVAIMIAMFIGRVGPLTLVVAMGTSRPLRFQYPREDVMIG